MNLIPDTSLDFFKQINETHDISYNTNHSNVCLITNDPLELDHIVLHCNHKFNYYGIFFDTVNQKKNQAHMQSLKTFELRCPYCRNIQDKILPYRKIPECDKKIHGVNFPSKYSMKNMKCCYVFKRGPRKGTQCNKESDRSFCNQHTKFRDKI